AVFAELDELLEAVAAGFVLFGRNGAARDQVLGIGLAPLAAALGRLEIGQHFAFAVHRIVEGVVVVVGVLGRAARPAPAGRTRTTADQVGQLVLGLLGACGLDLFRLVGGRGRLRCLLGGRFRGRFCRRLRDLHCRLGRRLFRRLADNTLGRLDRRVYRIVRRGGFA